MKLTAWVTVASLLMYFWVFSRVGQKRRKYKIAAPATDGPADFLVAQRVQVNTVEQLVFFIPSLWLCHFFMSEYIAASLGLVWVIGRIVYACGYYQAPSRRFLGFGIATLSELALLAATIIGLILH